MENRAKQAVHYAQMGVRIVMLHGIDQNGNCTCGKGKRCTSSGKHPIYLGWEQKATTAESEIIAEFKKHPSANIGFATGGNFFVLDIDTAHGGDESLKRFGKLSPTVSVRTGSGGSHHYYKIPQGMQIPNRVSILPGVDLRSGGGLVVAPGSRHKSGRMYQWMPGCSPDEIEIAEPDEWLLQLIQNAGKEKPISHEMPVVIEEGSRNAAMASIAGSLRRKGLSFEAILAALSVENQNRCQPPLGEDELETIAKSISRYTPEDPVTGREWNDETKRSLIAAVSDLKDFSRVFEPELLSQLVLAKKKDPTAFAVIKVKLRGKVNLNDLEKAIRHREKDDTIKESEFQQVLKLDGLETKGLIVPNGWRVDLESGVTRCIQNGDGSQRQVTASFAPVIIGRRFHNLDTGLEKVELSFYRDSHWKNVVASRSVAFNRNSILRLADSGFPVTSNNAGDLIAYLSDFEQANDGAIPVVQSVARLGWLKRNEFFPFSVGEGIEFETDSKEAAIIFGGLETAGDAERWLAVARQARVNPAARFMLSASFASVLLEPLHKRVFFIHLWHSSRSGKTATLKLAIAAWGNPHKLIGSFNSTIVGLERMASALRNLPFAIDELQVLNTKRMTTDSIIYMLSQGQGRTRGSRDGGLQETLTWRNIIITTGEEAMLGSNMQDGANSRTFELYAKPVEDTALASAMHEISEQHYGHAGRVFIEKLCEACQADPLYIQNKYEEIRAAIKETHGCGTHLDEVAVVALGDYLSARYVFVEKEELAMDGAIITVQAMLGNNRQLKQSDNVERAWEFFSGWLIANSSRFGFDAPSPQYGRLDEQKKYLVIPAFANKALEEAGFSPRKVFRGFAERGYIESLVDSEGIRRFQLGRSIMGKTCRVYVVKVPDHDAEDEKFLE